MVGCVSSAAGQPGDGLKLGLIRGGLIRRDLGDQADHQLGREGPGLAGVVAHVADRQPGLLHHLAGAGLLNRLARLHKAGQGRHPTGGPGGLTAQQAARFGPALIDRQHDDDRIDAREMLGPAGRADALPAAGRLIRRLAAGGAEAVTAAPVEQALGRGGDAGVGFGQDDRRLAHLDKTAKASGGTAGRIDGALELGGEDRRALPQTEEDVAIARQVARARRGLLF